MGFGDGPANTGTSASEVRRINFDSTGALALPKYMAILERILTPHGMRWHTLSPNPKSLGKSYRVRKFFDELNDALFAARYEDRAGFRQATGEMYASIGAYGTGPVFVGKKSKSAIMKRPGMIYRACTLRDTFMLLDSEGNVVAVYRRLFRNYRQFKADFPMPPSQKLCGR